MTSQTANFGGIEVGSCVESACGSGTPKRILTAWTPHLLINPRTSFSQRPFQPSRSSKHNSGAGPDDCLPHFSNKKRVHSGKYDFFVNMTIFAGTIPDSWELTTSDFKYCIKTNLFHCGQINPTDYRQSLGSALVTSNDPIQFIYRLNRCVPYPFTPIQLSDSQRFRQVYKITTLWTFLISPLPLTPSY